MGGKVSLCAEGVLINGMCWVETGRMAVRGCEGTECAHVAVVFYTPPPPLLLLSTLQPRKGSFFGNHTHTRREKHTMYTPMFRSTNLSIM